MELINFYDEYPRSKKVVWFDVLKLLLCVGFRKKKLNYKNLLYTSLHNLYKKLI